MQRAMVKFIVIVASTIGLLSCGELDGNSTGGSTIELQGQSSFLIDGSAKSCLLKSTDTDGTASPDVTSLYFRLRGLRFKPADSGQNYVVFNLKVVLEDAAIQGGKYTCQIDSDAMTEQVLSTGGVNDTALINSWKSNALGNVMLGADEVASITDENQRYLTLDCPILCGGVQLSSEVQTGTRISGYVELRGASYPKSDPYAETPLYDTINFEVIY